VLPPLLPPRPPPLNPPLLPPLPPPRLLLGGLVHVTTWPHTEGMTLRNCWQRRRAHASLGLPSWAGLLEVCSLTEHWGRDRWYDAIVWMSKPLLACKDPWMAHQARWQSLSGWCPEPRRLQGAPKGRLRRAAGSCITKGPLHDYIQLCTACHRRASHKERSERSAVRVWKRQRRCASLTRTVQDAKKQAFLGKQALRSTAGCGLPR
jgi:hypothetical protein